jgi:hypothetical protein
MNGHNSNTKLIQEHQQHGLASPYELYGKIHTLFGNIDAVQTTVRAKMTKGNEPYFELLQKYSNYTTNKMQLTLRTTIYLRHQ